MNIWEKAIAMGYNEMSKAEQDELERKLRKEQDERLWDVLRESASKGDWKNLCFQISTFPSIMKAAFDVYYEQIPDEMKYEFVKSLYRHHGDSYDNIRAAMKGLRKYGSPDLPEGISGCDYITIYRGGNEYLEEVPYALSWSLEQDVAEFFANRSIYRFCDEGYVYKGKIRTKDIIAFIDGSEKEIIQYGKVFDIEELDFIPGRVKALSEEGKAIPVDDR